MTCFRERSGARDEILEQALRASLVWPLVDVLAQRAQQLKALIVCLELVIELHPLLWCALVDERASYDL